ncbi:hypothetical protein RND71_014869 [Anisodus tanguticus]|uniref:Uncharacterized protein n=1 Tax=Anisodus tanguticus TaxID=243964 RepID=A0AAE1S9Y8_9SOLA|nr:hypothetical protein RND71_014869 [Anisodus tanguticus]
MYITSIPVLSTNYSKMLFEYHEDLGQLSLRVEVGGVGHICDETQTELLRGLETKITVGNGTSFISAPELLRFRSSIFFFNKHWNGNSSLLRFKCVAKSWKKLISEPYVTKKHLNHTKT